MRRAIYCSKRTDKGNALVEFAVILPFLLLLMIGMSDLCILLGHQLHLIDLGREAANVLSRGAGVQETFDAITRADGELELDGELGQVIVTRVAVDASGQPVIVEQHSIGHLDQASSVGTLAPGTRSVVPATVPNGRTVPQNMSLVVVELFSKRPYLLGATRLAFGEGTIVLRTLAAF